MLSSLVTHRSHARTENSLLRSKYLEEQVAWIGGEDPAISFGQLVHVSESHLPSLAKSLELLPSEEESQVSILNKIFRQLGVSCTDFTYFSLLIHRVTFYPLADSVSRHPFEDHRPADPNHNKPLMSPTEAPLYLFLAYLTMFVYSSIVL